jgi:hypothetical protein
MEIYNLGLLSKLVKQNKQIRDASYAEKEGKEVLQNTLSEKYKPLLTKQSEINKSQLAKLDELKIETNTILNEINRRIATGNLHQMDVGNVLKHTIENRPILIELIKTVTPNLGKVLLGEADVNILTKSEKEIFRIYDDLDNNDLKTLIDYYAFMKTPSVKAQAEISDEPHPADIAGMVREEKEDQGAVGGIEPPPYQVGGFQNEFKKGENRQYDDLVKTIVKRKTDDAIGIQWKNNEFILGDQKVYFNGNVIKIGEVESNYTIGLEQLLTKLTPDVSNPSITDNDINTYLNMLKQGNVEYEKPEHIASQKYIFKKLADC